MSMLKKIGLSIISGALCCSALMGQENNVSEKPFWKQNMYATFGMGNQWMWQGNSNKGMGYVFRLSSGTWFNDYSGLRIVASTGIRKTDGEYCNSYYMAGLDYTFNALALCRDYDVTNRFSLSLSAGVGCYNFLHTNKWHVRPGINLGANWGYSISERCGLFTELMFSGVEAYYSNNGGISVECDLLFGFRYYFKSHNYEKKPDLSRVNALESEVQTLRGSVKELNEEINRMRLEMQKMQEKVDTENKNVIYTPKNDISSIDIFFDKFSTYLGDAQLQKIDAIGEWMKNNDFDIHIVAFSDNVADKDVDERLRKGRTEVIKELLVEKYSILPERISIVKAEELGYVNLTGCNAKIMFVEKSK